MNEVPHCGIGGVGGPLIFASTQEQSIKKTIYRARRRYGSLPPQQIIDYDSHSIYSPFGKDVEKIIDILKNNVCQVFKKQYTVQYRLVVRFRRSVLPKGERAFIWKFCCI
jgi:hypothetical protein